ncbi:uncharacterized protein LOC144689096 [Cetorhinus maximus]
MSNPLCMGYEYVEIEEFHHSSSLFVKELVCSCQNMAQREVGNRRMVKDKFCFFCQREFFFTWALTCHFCKKINLFRVLYEGVNPLPCMHLPINYKPLVVSTAEAGVQAERCRCRWKKICNNPWLHSPTVLLMLETLHCAADVSPIMKTDWDYALINERNLS